MATKKKAKKQGRKAVKMAKISKKPIKKTKTSFSQEPRRSIHEVTECPECASQDILHNERKQQIVCKSCGLIYEPLTPEEEEKYAGGPF